MDSLWYVMFQWQPLRSNYIKMVVIASTITRFNNYSQLIIVGTICNWVCEPLEWANSRHLLSQSRFQTWPPGSQNAAVRASRDEMSRHGIHDVKWSKSGHCSWLVALTTCYLLLIPDHWNWFESAKVFGGTQLMTVDPLWWPGHDFTAWHPAPRFLLMPWQRNGTTLSLTMVIPANHPEMF